MIWDTLLYNGEKECLQIRCEELLSLNITHVLIDSNFTFSEKPKRTSYNYVEYFGEWLYPIYHFIDNDVPNNGNAWDNETHQRNYILNKLQQLNAKDDDIVIISDADEVPKVEAVKSYKPDMGLTALRMDNFWYKFNCLTERQSWLPARILTFAELKKSTPNEIRNAGYQSVIENAGWHFSYLGDADFIVNKLESFSHVEYNKPEYKNKEKITQQIESGEALWGNGKFQFIPLDETFPKYLYENQSKFKSLIHKV